MKKIYELPDSDLRFDEASQWIAKLDRGLSEEEFDEFHQWLAEDKENTQVLLEMAKLWDKMSVINRLSDMFPAKPSKHERTRRFVMATVATVFITFLAGIWTFSTINQNNFAGTTPASSSLPSNTAYETAIGEKLTVVLADGTEVVLNTNSLIKVHYTDKYRLLSLERGEIHVQVAHDTRRPLSVFASDKIVQAVGTAFKLEVANDYSIELVVTEGKVLVDEHQGTQGVMKDIHMPRLASSSVMVVAGEEFISSSSEYKLREVPPEEIESKLSWRKGNLKFNNDTLEDAINEISRYTTVEFVILEEDLKEKRIAGLFRIGDIDGLLATLRENFEVANQRTDDGKILLSTTARLDIE